MALDFYSFIWSSKRIEIDKNGLSGLKQQQPVSAGFG